MFYTTDSNDHGLPHDPIKALIVPRPIGWISSIGLDGAANLAPYSFFNVFSSDPPIVGFSSATRKDSQHNIEQSGEFVCNFASADLIDQINLTSSPVNSTVDEFELSGLGKAESRLISAPRVAEAHAHLECRYLKTVELPSKPDSTISWGLIMGEVVAVHIDDAFIKDGIVDTQSMQPLARLGYLDYGTLGEAITKPRPSK